jgi:hypothetical protein
VLFVTGAVVLCMAIWACWDKHSFIEYTRLIEDEELRTKVADRTESIIVNRTLYVIVAAVSLMLYVSSVGYRGATRESKCLLTYYGVILIIILVMEIVAGCLGTAYSYKAEKEIKAAMNASLQQYHINHVKEEKTDITIIWDRIFSSLECCGVNDYKDFWNKTKPFFYPDILLPEACCDLGFIVVNGSAECVKKGKW